MTLLIRRMTSLLLAAGIVASVGCSTSVVEPPILVGDSKRDTAIRVNTESRAEVISSNRAFAVDLYHALRVRAGNNNLVFSPHSLSTVLAMVYAGARGETEMQIKKTVHFLIPQNQLHPVFNRINLDLNGLDDKAGSGGFQLNVTNSIWAQTGYPFQLPFLNTLTKNYGQGIRLVDFKPNESRELARKQINQWAHRETSGRISELLKRDLLTKDTRLVLVNAVYFKGLWESPFDKPTQPGKFHLLDGQTVSVPMMEQRFNARIVDNPEFAAVEMPYRGDRARMLFVVPKEGRFLEFEESLAAETIDEIRGALKTRDTELFLPKFEYEADIQLAPILAEMGMPLAFDPNNADFSGMDGSRRLFLKHVVHKAMVKVDEKGTEAAAASAALVEKISMPWRIQIDRPFFYCIYDTQHGNLLFLGRVVDPRN